MNNRNRFMPLIMALCVVLGIAIGTFYAIHFSGNRLNIINSGSNRLTNLLHIIEDQYVDQVNIDSLVDAAIPQILSDLDPHSTYINAKDAQAVADELKGSFSGVGIEFTILDDTIRVQNVINNAPAQKAGILAGDKIVSIDDKPFVGKVVTNQEAMRRIKGQKNTQVKIGVMRYGSKEVKTFTVTRGDIPNKSVTAVYMIDKNTGYIKINNFSETTYTELLIALAEVSYNNCSSLIIDLRDNSGGLMNAAIQMANEFLPAKRDIVYTKGRNTKPEHFKSDGRGSYIDMPLVVLINENSASASEIFAGAMQDNDRATIIGRRSFGKGLVQQQIGFADGSLIRLTIARYYTPSGRCIQKPFNAGDKRDYEEDILSRYKHGELFSQDSIHHTGPAYHTRIGREVYGGGGITPDIFVPEDTTGMTSYYKQAAMSGLIIQFAYYYTDSNRPIMSKFDNYKELDSWLTKQNLVEKFASFAEKKGLKRRNIMIRKSGKLLQRYIHSRIIYSMLDDNEWMQYLNQDDNAVSAAMNVFKKGEAFPKVK